MGPRLTSPDDVLASPALGVLLDLEQGGFHVSLSDDDTIIIRPGSRLTDAHKALIAHHKLDLKLLLRCADEGVALRRDTFRHQVAAAPPGTFPALLFRLDLPYTAGACFSCGDALQTFRYGRCWRCALAWRLAASVPVPSDLADALDGARME